MNRNKIQHPTPAHCKGTKNYRNTQAFRKINAAIVAKSRKDGIYLDDVYISDGSVTIEAHTRGITAICPCCKTRSHSIKDHRLRKIQTTEFLSCNTVLILQVRRFRCTNTGCVKKTFMEPLQISRPYSRMTEEANDRIEYESLNQSARLARESLSRQHIVVSNSTCIRRARIKGIENPKDFKCSGYVAIDDWAYRKGRRYMCAIVDHYSGKVIAVFDGRYIEQIEEWFRAHPEVKLVSRDGSWEYASLIRRGRPEAQQVSDRFHLIKNLKDTMVDSIRSMLGQRKEKLKYQYPTEGETYECIMDDIKEMGDERHRRKVGRCFAIQRMQNEGKTVSEIANALSVKSTYVYKLKDASLRRVLTREQITALRYSHEMARIIAGGTISPTTVSKKLDGKLSTRTVSRCMRKIRKKYSELRRTVREHNKELESTGKCIKVSKQPVWSYIMTGQTKCGKLLRLKTTHPEIDSIINVCINFRKMIHGEDGTPDVEEWIREAEKCNSKELYSFAQYVASDKNAIRMAYKTNFNNGIMEGTVNKIKAIKRSMFNRASAPMLRAKLIYSSY